LFAIGKRARKRGEHFYKEKMSNRTKSHSSEMINRSSSTDYEDDEEDHFSSFWAFNSFLGLLSAIGMALLIVFPYWVDFKN